MPHTSNPIANPMIVLRQEFDDWAILFDPDTGDAYGINPVGVFIWNRLDGEHTCEAIIKEIRKNCENEPHNIENDVNEFIKDLEKKGYAGYEYG